MLVVRECTPGTRLPRYCPELHINSDGSFCLGRRAYRAAEESDALAFWQSLGEFLVNQHFAARRRHWPTGRWLSHGSVAADLQARAEAVAELIGFEADYANCLELDEGWFTDEAKKPGERISVDTNCPRGCRSSAGREVRFAECPHRRALKRIVKAERLRRAAEGEFFLRLTRGGVKCCGRVTRCPLAQGAAT